MIRNQICFWLLLVDFDPIYTKLGRISSQAALVKRMFMKKGGSEMWRWGQDGGWVINRAVA
jgi:hypothetical protein